MHVFPYSIRPGTSAAHFDGQVASEKKTERVQELINIAKGNTSDFRAKQIGSIRPVLWEEVQQANGTTIWSGLTDNYIRVTAHSNRPLANQITDARIVSQDGSKVFAEVIIS